MVKLMDYVAFLERNFEEERRQDPAADTSRLEYLSEYVFQFTTYDSEMSALFGRKALDVCYAITTSATFEFIADKDNYQWFLVMCNMPFFEKRLEWGTSIRGAWWDIYGDDTFEIDGLWKDEECRESLTLNAEEWGRFILAMREFARR